MATPSPVVPRGYHNIQQLSDAVVALETASNDASQNAASFLISEVQPLRKAIADLQASVTQLQAQLKALQGGS